MAIVVKEIIVKTTVEKSVKQVPVDENLIRRIKEQVKVELQDEESWPRDAKRGKNR
ncbi:hypothetical protein [Bacteroides sp. 51]|uniref:hypothetical protein n=1 Tax=Bacteroides sp. 51 TaxID=2302938 RepID=UPI0013D2BEB8|nr:hypothetical protein [Bacteroides sp. 51]